MKTFLHSELALRVHAGPDCLKQLERELARLGASRAVIFCGNTLSKDPLVQQVATAAGARFAGIYPGVKAHTPHAATIEAADELKRLQGDAIIAIGGGSASVSARAAAIYLAEGYDLDAMSTRRDEATGRMISPRLEKPKIPIVTIPTTPNTAFVKAGAGVFDTEAGHRKPVFDPKTRSLNVFLHPGFLMSAPRRLVVSAGLDTLSLALEGLVSKPGNPISDALLMHSVRLMVDGLPRLAGDDGDQLRADLTMAGILGGRGTDHSGAGAATVIGHAIGANHHVDNGTAKAVVLPHVLRFNAGHAAEGLTRLAVALGLPASPDAEPINAAFDKVYRALGVPGRLRDLDIPQDALPGIAERSMLDYFLTTNPRPVTDPADLLAVLKQAW